jgi:hypothetical protein
VSNEGKAQRSNVSVAELHFDGDLNFQSLIDEGRIGEVVRLALDQSGSLVDLAPSRFQWDRASRTLLIDLTVDGFGGSGRTILGDSRYRLLLQADQIHLEDEPGRILSDDDGDHDGVLSLAFHQLYGDGDGDGDVDNADAFALKTAMNSKQGQASYLDYLDFDDDGVIDAFDFAEMKKRYGKKLPS